LILLHPEVILKQVQGKIQHDTLRIQRDILARFMTFSEATHFLLDKKGGLFFNGATNQVIYNVFSGFFGERG